MFQIHIAFNKYLFGYVMSTYVTVLKIQWYLKLAHTYLYWIHKNLYHGYKNLSVAAMKKKLYFAICIKQFRDVVHMVQDIMFFADTC